MRFGKNNFCLSCYAIKQEDPSLFYCEGKNQLYCKKCTSERRKKKRAEAKKLKLAQASDRSFAERVLKDVQGVTAQHQEVGKLLKQIEDYLLDQLSDKKE